MNLLKLKLASLFMFWSVLKSYKSIQAFIENRNQQSGLVFRFWVSLNNEKSKLWIGLANN